MYTTRMQQETPLARTALAPRRRRCEGWSGAVNITTTPLLRDPRSFRELGAQPLITTTAFDLACPFRAALERKPPSPATTCRFLRPLRKVGVLPIWSVTDGGFVGKVGILRLLRGLVILDLNLLRIRLFAAARPSAAFKCRDSCCQLLHATGLARSSHRSSLPDSYPTSLVQLAGHEGHQRRDPIS